MSTGEKIFFAIVFISEIIIFAIYIHHNADSITNWIKEHTPKSDTERLQLYNFGGNNIHEFWMPMSGGYLLKSKEENIHIPHESPMEDDGAYCEDDKD